MTAEPAIAAAGVRFAYDGVDVLRDVDLDIAPGEFVAIVGPNGGGKTTLLKLILGLLRPQQGTIRVLGRSPKEARPSVGYLPQHLAYDSLFPVTVLDVVLMGRLGVGVDLGPFGRRDRAAALAALAEVNLVELAGRPFAALSGGQRQRVLLARALVCDPALLLLDEPLAHVDVVVIDDLYEVLAELSRRRTVVMVSHDIGFVSRAVGRVVCVNRTVTMHPTGDITGATISRLYGTEMHVVRHDERCGPGAGA
jgi:zinc transport system ATP-binding protein